MALVLDMWKIKTFVNYWADSVSSKSEVCGISRVHIKGSLKDEMKSVQIQCKKLST